MKCALIIILVNKQRAYYPLIELMELGNATI